MGCLAKARQPTTTYEVEIIRITPRTDAPRLAAAAGVPDVSIASHSTIIASAFVTRSPSVEVW